MLHIYIYTFSFLCMGVCVTTSSTSSPFLSHDKIEQVSDHCIPRERHKLMYIQRGRKNMNNSLSFFLCWMCHNEFHHLWYTDETN